MVCFHSFLARTVLIAIAVVDVRAAGVRAQEQPDTTQTVLGVVPNDEDVRTETVAIDRNALADDTGRAAVMVRIDRAVRRVCRFDENTSLADRAAFEACRTASLADVDRQLSVLVARYGNGPLRIALAEPRP